MTFLRALEFMNEEFFARWMEAEADRGKRFCGEDFPVLFNHPAVKVVVRCLNLEGARGEAYAYKLAAMAEFLAEQGLFFQQAIAAYVVILVEHASPACLKVMEAEPFQIAQRWLDQRCKEEPKSVA